MPNAQISWRHHYLPEFYLKRWSAISGELVEYSKPHANVVKPKRVSPRQTGWVKWLYALEGLPDEQAHIPEVDFYKPVDTRAANALAKIEQQADLTSADRVAWAQFMLSMVFRTPENVEATKDRLFKDLLQTTRKDEMRWKRTRSASDAKTLKEAFDSPSARLATNRHAMRTIMEVSSSEKIGNHLLSMKWASRKLPFDAPALLTSDRPLLWFNALDQNECHIIMPIGPNRFFFATNTEDMAMLIASQPAQTIVRFVNEMVIRRAINFAYAMGDGHLSYIQTHMGAEPEVTIPDRVVMMRQQRKQPNR